MVAQENASLYQIFRALNTFKGNKELTVSSYLKEPDKSDDFYAPKNLLDDKKETAWAIRKNQGLGEYVYLSTLDGEHALEFQDIKDRDLKYNLEVINGYAENERLFKANRDCPQIR